MRLAPLFALLACHGPEPVLEATTDGGTWVVRLHGLPEGPGDAELGATVDPASGVITSVTASMPDMGHTADGEVEGSDGEFVLTLPLSMSGWWVLDGEVEDEARAESFRLEFEVP